MIIVLTGGNSFELRSYLQKIIQQFELANGDSIERFDGSEIDSPDQIIDAVRSISFLEPKKLVIVRNFSTNKQLMSKIKTIIDQTADSTELVLIDSHIDKRTADYKYLKQNTTLKIFDVLQNYELERWATKFAEDINLKISKNNIVFLIERVGPDQLRLSQEMTKLSCTGRDINRELIEELIDPTPQSKVFDMLDALFKGQLQKAYELYEDQRSQGEEPQKLISMITWQLQQLLYAVYSPIKTVDWLVKNANMTPFSANKALMLSKSITKKDLKFYITELAYIDNVSKTSADVESALAVYFSEVST